MSEGPAAQYVISISRDLTGEHIRALDHYLGRDGWRHIRLHHTRTTIWLLNLPSNQTLTVLRLCLPIEREGAAK